MNTESNEYTVDKTGWPEGPWMTEPDKLVWIDVDTDLDCMAVRAPTTGAWCGYVGVPPRTRTTASTTTTTTGISLSTLMVD